MKYRRFKSLTLISLLSIALVACGGGAKSDAEIQKEVQARVKTPGVTVTSVQSGVVTLGGYATSQSERDAALAAAKGEGVTSVKDNIQIKPPGM